MKVQLLEAGVDKAATISSKGSIPIIPTFEKSIRISVLMGFGLEPNAIHSPNENRPLEERHENHY